MHPELPQYNKFNKFDRTIHFINTLIIKGFLTSKFLTCYSANLLILRNCISHVNCNFRLVTFYLFYATKDFVAHYLFLNLIVVFVFGYG